MTITVIRPFTSSIPGIITSLAIAKEVADGGAGNKIHDCDFNGVLFKGFINAQGWLMIAASPAFSVSNGIMEVDVGGPVQWNSATIFSEEIVTSIPDLGGVVIENAAKNVSIRSTERLILDRLLAYKQLAENVNEQALWIPKGAISYALGLNNSNINIPLNESIYWAYNNTQGLHFKRDVYKLSWTGENNSLALWVHV